MKSHKTYCLLFTIATLAVAAGTLYALLHNPGKLLKEVDNQVTQALQLNPIVMSYDDGYISLDTPTSRRILPPLLLTALPQTQQDQLNKLAKQHLEKTKALISNPMNIVVENTVFYEVYNESNLEQSILQITINDASRIGDLLTQLKKRSISSDHYKALQVAKVLTIKGTTLTVGQDNILVFTPPQPDALHTTEGQVRIHVNTLQKELPGLYSRVLKYHTGDTNAL